MVEKVKKQAKKTATDTVMAFKVLIALLATVALVRLSVVAWYHDAYLGVVPFDRIMAGIGFSLVLCYFINLHYKSK